MKCSCSSRPIFERGRRAVSPKYGGAPSCRCAACACRSPDAQKKRAPRLSHADMRGVFAFGMSWSGWVASGPPRASGSRLRPDSGVSCADGTPGESPMTSTIARVASILVAVTSILPHCAARNRSAPPGEAAAVQDLALASRILANEGVLDAYGHVSLRHPADPNRYLMARSLAPALITPADIHRIRSRFKAGEADRAAPVHRALHPRRDLSGAARREGDRAQPLADRDSVRHQRRAAAPGVSSSARSSTAACRCSRSASTAGDGRDAGAQRSARRGAGQDARRQDRRADARARQRRGRPDRCSTRCSARSTPR